MRVRPYRKLLPLPEVQVEYTALSEPVREAALAQERLVQAIREDMDAAILSVFGLPVYVLDTMPTNNMMLADRERNVGYLLRNFTLRESEKENA